jgi:diguanylate cyclase (GGDEF)-like protein
MGLPLPMMKLEVAEPSRVGDYVQRFLFDLRAQLCVLITVLAIGTAASVGAQVLTVRHLASLDARRQAISQIEESARRAEIEAVVKAFDGSSDQGPLDARMREVDGGLTALLVGDPVVSIAPAPPSVAAAIEQAQLIWAQERAQVLQAAASVPALRVALDDGTSRQFTGSMHVVDARFEASGRTEVQLLNIVTLAASVFATVFAFAVTSALLRQVRAPLKRLEGLSKEIEAGNIWARYGDTYPSGMVGRLARSFDQMVESLGTKAQLGGDALTDELTGLPNRRAFFIALDEIVQEAERTGGTFDVCFVDVDEFKNINDQFGHSEGDIALQDVAHVLRHRFGESSVIGRLGGDEFAVIYVGAERLATETVSNEVALLLAELADAAERVCAVELSVGVSPYSRGDTPDSLVQRADRSMYGEKRARSEARSRRRGAA